MDRRKRRANEEGDGAKGKKEAHADLVLGRLPEEVLLMIFSHLCQEDLLLRASLVCKAWKRVAEDISLWKQVELDKRRVTLKRAMELIPTMTQLKGVRLVRWKNLPVDPILTLVADLYPRLESLDLTDCSVSSRDTFMHVVQNCKDIKELTLVHVYFPTGAPHPSDAYAQHANLEKVALDLTCKHMRLDTSIQRNWPRLTDVELHYSCHSADAELKAVCAAAAGHIRKLKIGTLFRPQSCHLLNQCCQLEDLELEPRSAVRLRCVQEGISTLRNLRRLVLMPVHKATLSEISSFFSAEQVLGKLECLEIARFNMLRDRHLSLIASNCPQLTSLFLLECLGITRSGLVDQLSKCQKLKSVELDDGMYRELFPKPPSQHPPSQINTTLFPAGFPVYF